MPYDLHGNYYRNSIDAQNAEMAQVAEIDARHTRMEFQQVQRQQKAAEQSLYERMVMLEERISQLEKMMNEK